MTRTKCLVLGWSLPAAFLVTTGMADAKADKSTTLKQIMDKLNSDAGLRKDIDKNIKADSPDWDAVQKLTKKYLNDAKLVPEKEPPKGDKDSWTKLSKEYVVVVKSLDDAAQSKDQKMCKEAYSKMMMSCRGCHMEHRPMKKR